MENLTDTLKKARIVAVLAVNDPSGAVDLAKALCESRLFLQHNSRNASLILSLLVIKIPPRNYYG